MNSIQNLQKKLKELQDEIKKYQQNCQHKNQQIRFDDRQNARWFCNKCDKIIRLPSQQELQDWISK
jgi:hypothetical protein